MIDTSDYLGTVLRLTRARIETAMSGQPVVKHYHMTDRQWEEIRQSRARSKVVLISDFRHPRPRLAGVHVVIHKSPNPEE